jgi:hypothetical protein
LMTGGDLRRRIAGHKLELQWLTGHVSAFVEHSCLSVRRTVEVRFWLFVRINHV